MLGNTTRGPMGPGVAHLNHCKEERMFTTNYNFHSPTLKSIFGITQTITKAYQVTKFNQIILTIQCLTFLPNPKGQGVHNVNH